MLTTTIQQVLEELARRERGEGTRLTLDARLFNDACKDKLVTSGGGRPDGPWPRLTAAGRIALADGAGEET